MNLIDNLNKILIFIEVLVIQIKHLKIQLLVKEDLI